jgi:nucleoside-diphosphate-sugar epimerase
VPHGKPDEQVRRPAKRILVTGALGQIGSELTEELRRRYGAENVLATGQELSPGNSPVAAGPYEPLDVTDAAALDELVRRYRIDTIYHLAAILSASGERNPQQAWDVNIGGLHNVLECARKGGLSQVFCPSSIAVFGPGTPLERTPQDAVTRPATIYGVTKVAGELLCDYYFRRYGLDVRGLRYPGVISHRVLPGGGTTDYAVEIFYAAVQRRPYVCFVKEETVLPMIYMPDCLKAAIDLMDADLAVLKHHSNFNVQSMSFSAGELAAEIKKHRPEFVCEFQPDERQAIADTWPRSIDDTAARREWGWRPQYDLAMMTADMLARLEARKAAGQLA